VDPWEEPDASTTAVIMGALFDIKVRLVAVEEHVVTIRRLLEEIDEHGEEDPEP
jgi:hypothetical protein